MSQNFKGKGTSNTLKPLVITKTFFNFCYVQDVAFCWCYIAPQIKR
jgi:hypothetical protein